MLLHLLKKDFVHLRLWLALTWAAWGLLLLHPFLGADSIFRSTAWLLLVNGAGWMMTLLTLARLIHLDPLAGSDQFLAVRPVSRGMLIGSKLLFMGMFLLLPLFVIRVLHIALLRLDLSATDYLLLIPGLLLPLTAAHLLFLLPSVFTRRTAGTVLVLVGVAILGFFLVLGANRTAAAGGAPVQPEWIHLTASRFYIVLAVFIGCAAWAIVRFATTRRWVHPALAAISAIALSLAAMRYWPVNFVHALNPKSLAAPAAEQPDEGVLKLVPTRAINNGKAWATTHQDNNVRIETVAAPLQLEGLGTPWFSRQDAFHSTARFENGSTRESHGAPYWSPEETEPLRDAAAGMLGFSVPEDILRGFVERLDAHLDVFRMHADAWDQAKTQSPLASIEGQATLTLARPKVLHVLPLRPGASATNRHTRYTIRQVSQYPERVTLKITIESARVPLRGEITSEQARDTLFLVANPTSRTFFLTGGGSGNSGGVGFYSLSEKTFSVDCPSPGNAIEQLRLYIITAETARQVSLPFRLRGTELP
ncbi:MAG: hypothetical protein PHQ12_15030 [Chthoniobacteraceae bacterium]|nr:hypothetical protein [Chthoniobacteraceae bacterium]